MKKSPTITISKRLTVQGSIWLTIGLLVPMPLNAYEFTGEKWPTPTTTFFVDIAGANGLWNEAFENAMAQWNNSTSFVYLITRGVFEHPCNSNGRNGVDFTSDVCGDAYGSNTLAITSSLFLGSTLSETDILFNANESWNVYSGPYNSGTWSGIHDFQRVAVHELGHALGLGHEEDVPAIMTSAQAIGNTLTAPTADDIAGVNAIYFGCSGAGGAPSIGLNETVTGTLSFSDCTVDDISGDGDISFVDLYAITLPAPGTLTLRMESTQFDTFLVLMDSNLVTTFAQDDDSGGGTNSLFSVPLVAGDYVILANSAFSGQQDTGTYTLTTSFSNRTAKLVSAVLPTSRSVQVGDTATAFAAVINTQNTTAISCGLQPMTFIPASFSYQTTDPATNALVGVPNTPIDIAAGGMQTYLFAFTATAAFNPTDVQLTFDCSNTNPAPVTTGLNTLLLSASNTPVPDIVALAATPTGNGIVSLPGTFGANAFAVATVNVGVSGDITATVDTGSVTLPLVVSLCQTDSATGACLMPAAGSITTTIDASATPTFAIFVGGKAPISLDPANNRIFVRFKDAGGLTRGSTSVAIQTL